MPALKQITVSDYVKNRSVKMFDFTFCIHGGKSFYRWNDKKFSQQELDEAFPTPDPRFCGDNPDKKHVR